MARLQVFEWQAWQYFLITHVLPGAERVPVTPGEKLCPPGPPRGPALVHVNLSRPDNVFPDYERCLRTYEERGLPLLNGYCLSIDKWSVQAACEAAGLPGVRASREGDSDEILIIKSRANHRGLYEKELSP